MAVDAAKGLVMHLVAAQIDNPDHIHLISPGTHSYDLLLTAAAALFDQPRAEIEARIKSERQAIQAYRPLIAAAVRWRQDAERYELALGQIAYEGVSEPVRAARKALGDDE